MTHLRGANVGLPVTSKIPKVQDHSPASLSHRWSFHCRYSGHRKKRSIWWIGTNAIIYSSREAIPFSSQQDCLPQQGVNLATSTFKAVEILWLAFCSSSWIATISSTWVRRHPIASEIEFRELTIKLTPCQASIFSRALLPTRVE